MNEPLHAEPQHTLPHNLDAERSVLGSVLVQNAGFEVALGIIRDDDWYRDAHRRIWKAMKALNEQGSVIDFVTLKDQLAKQPGDLDETGGPSYIAQLGDGVPRSTNVRYYAEIVHEKAQLRAIIYAANTLMTRAYEAEDSADLIAAQGDRVLLDIQNARTTNRMVNVQTSVAGLFADLEARIANRGQITGVTTGFPEIDGLTRGWQAGDLIVIGARPSIGKTTFAMNAGLAAAREGKHVVVFSLEMRRKQLEYRLLSQLSGVQLSGILAGHLASTDYARIADALSTLATLNIVIDDRAGQGVWDIRGACRRLKSDGQLDLVIVDYVQLMQGSDERKGANRNEQITDISRKLKILADEVSAPIILVSQLSRAASARQDKRPQLSDLRESGALEQDADVVAFLHREHHKQNGSTEFIIEKARNGPTGTTYLDIDRYTVTFTQGREPGQDAPAATGRAATAPSPSLYDVDVEGE